MMRWDIGIVRSRVLELRILSRGIIFAALVGCLSPGFASDAVAAADANPSDNHGHGSLDDVGRKLANPVSDVWALYTEFDLGFNNGEANGGEDFVFFQTLFQPVMPIKLTDSWKLITRPTLPIIWTAPDPTEGFSREIGLGDFVLPLVPARNNGLHLWGGELVGGVGPSFVFPTSTSDGFGNQKYEVGVANISVWKNEKVTVGIFPQWWWGVGDRGASRPDSSHGELLYFFYYNLPNAWQVGTNPVITIDANAPSNNKWNVPIGITVAKTVKIGNTPVKFQLGAEYSVVSQDSYGKRGMIKLNVIPVIPDLIKKPLF
jgi:hypothetical protein